MASVLTPQSTPWASVSRGDRGTEPLPEPCPPRGAASRPGSVHTAERGPQGHSIRGPAQLPEGQGGKLWVGVAVPTATSQRAPPPRL